MPQPLVEACPPALQNPESEMARKKAEADRLRAAEKFMKIGTGEAQCMACGYEYSPKEGDSEYPISPGTPFQVSLPLWKRSWASFVPWSSTLGGHGRLSAAHWRLFESTPDSIQHGNVQNHAAPRLCPDHCRMLLAAAPLRCLCELWLLSAGTQEIWRSPCRDCPGIGSAPSVGLRRGLSRTRLARLLVSLRTRITASAATP